MKKLLLIAVLSVALSACTDVFGASRVLESQGMTEIELTGYAWFSCSEDDFYKTKFRAVSVTGEKVSGAVCSGLFFKGATVRYD